MRSFIRNARRRGFSMVELMITVAIIGVLATIGVPTFRGMIQKAKKSEAKVTLGGIYTSEVAFFSEYNTYASALSGIGFDVGGSTQTYLIGFPKGADCTDQYATNATAEPLVSKATGNALNAAFPGYYTGTLASLLPPASNVPTKCLGGVVDDLGAGFNATATGKISPNSTASLATLSTLDQWQIDQTRALANINDGVNK